MNASAGLELRSGQSLLSVSSETGKLARLECRGSNLFVSPLDHELEQALKDDNRNQFGSLDAWGGDECFPTVGGSSLWQIRDHGALWAKAPAIQFAQSHHCTTGWQTGAAQFKRSIFPVTDPLPQNRLGAYAFHCEFPASLPCAGEDGHTLPQMHLLSLYASHALFEAEPGDRVEWGTLPQALTWDDALTGAFSTHVAASRVFAEDGAKVASKFYVRTEPRSIFCTSLLRKRLGLRIDVLQDDALPWVGIWWCHNGWGDGRPHSTVGIEPTNLPSDGPVLSFGGTPDSGQKTVRFAWVISKYTE
ncbi:MAG: hypothetical protein RIR26_1833 [Pseudomonadota bacterium]|jgi:hypothetical protein